MAHGSLNPTDLRTERNLLGSIASAIGDRIGNSSNMARKERAFASKKAEDGGTSLEEAGIGKGYFFKRALGSSFGGDRIARTRGRFESDPGPGRDPTGSQASRFRGGFDYNVSNEIFSPAEDGGGLASFFGGAAQAGGGVAQNLLEAGPQAINPEVLGGEVAKYQGTKTNAAGFSSVDTTATEIKDIAGILNQIGQIIVRSNNTTVQAIDSVQRINVKVVDSVQSLGQLQVGIAERQLQQQMLIASNAENTQEKIASRQLAAAEKSNMSLQRKSSGDLDPEGSGFEGPQGGILGNMLGGMGNLLDTGLSMLGGGRRGRRRGLGRMSRAGRRAQRASGLSTANAGGPGIRGMNFRNNSMTGSKLSTNRILAGTAGPGDSLAAAQNDITKRYSQRYGQKAAMKRFGAEGLEAAGMGLAKGARVMKFLSPVLKRVPIVGGLLDFGISLALGEPVGRAAAKAVGATLGAGLGSFVPIPGVGTILGGIAGDLVGGAIYDALTGGNKSSNSNSESLTPFASGGIVTRPVAGLVGEAGQEGVFPLEGAKGKKTFLMFGEGMLEAQKNNKRKYAELQASGFSEYFDKKPWWKGLLEALGKLLPKWMRGGGDDDRDRTPGGGGDIDVSKLAGDTPEAKAWLAAINATEAGGKDRYNTLVGGEVVPELSKMTMQEVYDMAYGSSIGQGFLPERFGGRKVEYGADSHAAGAFQFHPGTMMARVKDAGMDPTTTLYTPENQQKLALAHLMSLGVDPNKAMDSASLSKAGSMAGWQGLSVENNHITESGAMKLYSDMLKKANSGSGQFGDLTPPINPLSALMDPVEDKNDNLFLKSLMIQQQEKQLQQNPFVITVPAPTTQSSTQESQATTSMATGGSSALGLIAFAQLQTTP
jgi:muramidase (phage lysozyme)